MTNAYFSQPNDSVILPTILSIFVHGLVVAWLFFWQASIDTPIDAGIETTFVSQGELDAIEAQIRQNALAKQQTTKPSQAKPQTATKQANNSAFDDDLAQREAEFQAQIAKFAAEQDALALADMQAFERAIAQEQANAKQALNASRQAFANQDETVKHNQAQLDEARKQRDERIDQAKANAQRLGGISGTLSSQQDTSAHQSNQSRGGQKGNKNEVISALIRIIRPNWQVPSNAQGEKLRASIRVDGNGNVLSVAISGGSPSLESSLENAIRNSSPLTPIVGTEYRNLSITFIAE